MELFRRLREHLGCDYRKITLVGISYEDATAAAKLIDWWQFHIHKTGKGTVSAMFVASEKEVGRVWNYVCPK